MSTLSSSASRHSSTDEKRIYDYEGEKPTRQRGEEHQPLSDRRRRRRSSRQAALHLRRPGCEYGSKPTDGGHLIVEEEDQRQFLAENPGAQKYLRPLLCAEEYLYSIPRWCLWLGDATSADIRNNLGIKKRVEAVRDIRLASQKGPTREGGRNPRCLRKFGSLNRGSWSFHSTLRRTRRYIPFGYFRSEVYRA